MDRQLKCITALKNKFLKKIISILFLFFFALNGNAQLTSGFIMNSMGAIPGLQNNGLAIQFKSSATCLTVQNGNAILYGERAKGEFAMSCEVILKPGSLGVKLYPNPVVNNTKVQFINTPPKTELFRISILSAEGFEVMARKESGVIIFQGVNIDLANLIAGTYILKIESPHFMDAVKFVKSK